jgi:hypothetical protein
VTELAADLRRLPIAMHPWEVAETPLPTSWSKTPGVRLMVVVDGARQVRHGGTVVGPEDRAAVLRAAIGAPASGLPPARPVRLRLASPTMAEALAPVAESLSVRLEHVHTVADADAALQTTLRQIAIGEPVPALGLRSHRSPAATDGAPLLALTNGAVAVSIGLNADEQRVVCLRLSSRDAARLARKLARTDALSVHAVHDTSALIAWEGEHRLGLLVALPPEAERTLSEPGMVHLWVVGGGPRKRAIVGEAILLRRPVALRRG